MAIGKNHAACRSLHTLFSVGTLGGLSDRQLLETFTARGGATAEAAFAALVERHGPMVLRVCRSVLHDPHDAEDAFQGTFLALLRKANSLWVRDSLGPWLQQVALRTASRARSAAARRRGHERKAAEQSRHTAGEDTYDETSALLDEVDRLPERYRFAVRLCLLEGLTRDDAAKRLGWRAGTLQSRLARGRNLLRQRLSHRGLAVAASTSDRLPQGDRVVSTVPARLVNATARTAALASVGRPALGSSARGFALRVLGVSSAFRVELAAAFIALVTLAGSIVINHQATPNRTGGVPVAGGRGGQGPGSKERALAGGTALRPLIVPGDLKAHAGHGSLLVFALDEKGNRIPAVMPDSFQEAAEAHRWVVITGVLDHRAIRERLAQSLHVAVARAHPDYRRVEVERQERGPGGGWSDWEGVDRDRNNRILRNVPEVARERTPQDVRLDRLVDPLPYLTKGTWEGVDAERLVPAGKGGVPRRNRKIGGEGGGGLPFPTTDAPEILVRSLDFTVRKGTTYRYRVRIVVDVGERREVAGPWSVPTTEVRSPD